MNTNTENRVVFHTTRFTEEEAAEVVAHADACGQSISSLIRARVLGHSLPKGSAPPLNISAWRELSSTAANINQLTHHFNLAAQTGEQAPHSGEVMKLLRDLDIKLKDVRLQMLGAK